MRKVLIICGSRGDYGFIKPVINEIKSRKDITYKTLLTNMHLLPKFGNSFREFEKDDIEINYKIYNTLDGYTNVTMAKSLGIYILQLPEILEDYKPDIVLISGDRGEHLMSAIACSHMNIPVAHIQAGEVSGNVDGNIRHSITKLAHIHFCSNTDAYDRVKKLGEEEFRIFNTGAPQLDEIFRMDFPTNHIRKKLSIPEGDICLIINHSITEESDESGEQMKTLIDSMKLFDYIKVLIMPNSDAGSLEVRKIISGLEEKDGYFIYYNLNRNDFIAIMKECKFIIGNSSCGLIEAPVFKKPTINIGRRQMNRLQTKNVINCEYDTSQIVDSIKKLDSDMFKKDLESVKSVYGDGNSSGKIVDILENIQLGKKLTDKKITY